MIVSQTPLRISFAGGATDFARYYREHEGLVVSAAIDKYIYVIVSPRFDDLIYVNYSKKEIVDTNQRSAARAGSRGAGAGGHSGGRRDHHAG
jgi:galactokinase/mevalonate kinase-like predicted kinase